MADFLSSFFLWILYYAGHSILALDEVKTWSAQHWKYHNRAYRLMYNLWAGIGLLGMLFWMRFHQGSLIIDRMLVTGSIFALTGMAIVYLGARKYDMGVFMGLMQWQFPQSLEAHEKSTLVTNGLQNYIRHPLYTGTILLLLGWFLLFPDHVRLAWLTSTLIYLPFGIYLEEKKLIKIFGEEYKDYKKRTGALWPRISASKN